MLEDKDFRRVHRAKELDQSTWAQWLILSCIRSEIENKINLNGGCK